jgi:Holliday junction resolvase
MGFQNAGRAAPDSAGNGPFDAHSLAACCCNLPNSAAAPAAQGKKRGGRASRQKGNRLERGIVRLLQDHGLAAERIPLSGSAGGSYAGDLTVPFLGRDLVVEVKASANGFARLYSWLEDRDALVIKADRRHALVILPLRLAAEIAIAAERRKP